MSAHQEIRVEYRPHGQVVARAFVIVRDEGEHNGDWLLADVNGRSAEDALGALSRALLRELARARGYTEP